jgi:hypothetical protein
MKEIVPDLWHWKARHEGIGHDVHSYYVARKPAYVIDPMVPAEGLAWFRQHEPPANVFLTNRHHYRHADRFEQEFRARVWCHEAGLHEFTRGEKVEAFRFGDQLPGGVTALEIGAICAEETALLLPIDRGVLAIADAIVRMGGELGFVPDSLLGEDAETIKSNIRGAFRRHLDRGFAHVLFAHGEPLVGDGKRQLERFVAPDGQG